MQNARLPRVLVLVLSIDQLPWTQMEDAQRETWVRDCPEGVSVLYYRAHSPLGIDERLRHRLATLLLRLQLKFRWGVSRALDRVQLDGDILQFPALHESIPNTAVKLRAALQWALQNSDFDYVFRTNSSSYIDLQRLMDYVLHAQTKGLYAGHSGIHGELPYVSGIGILMSRDVVETMCSGDNLLVSLVDDIALAQVARREALSIVGLDRVLCSDAAYVSELPDEEFRASFIYRCSASVGRGETISATMHAIDVRLGRTVEWH